MAMVIVISSFDGDGDLKYQNLMAMVMLTSASRCRWCGSPIFAMPMVPIPTIAMLMVPVSNHRDVDGADPQPSRCRWCRSPTIAMLMVLVSNYRDADGAKKNLIPSLIKSLFVV